MMNVYARRVERAHAAPTRHDERSREAASTPAEPHPLLALQRTAGNAAVARLLRREDPESQSHRVVQRQAPGSGTAPTAGLPRPNADEIFTWYDSSPFANLNLATTVFGS